MLERLFIVRHGACEIERTTEGLVDRELTWDGRKQSSAAAEAILDATTKLNIFVVTSDAPRSILTADIISNKLACRFRVADYLNLSTTSFHMALKPLIATPEIYAYEAIVFITHEAFLMETIRALTEQFGYTTTVNQNGVLPYGTVLCIDIQKRTIELLQAARTP